ncbi:MAG: ATP-binding protein [Candidatus Kaiserbacteria bacterium]|nr:ATP-binding protein [Candidatus Kaiserbacteria bacterium]
MSKNIGHVLAVSGAQLTVEVDPQLSDLHVRHEGATYTVGQPGTYLIVDAGHDKHLVLVTSVRKSKWAPAESAVGGGQSNPLLPAGHFPFLPTPTTQIDKTLIDGVFVGTIVGGAFEVGVSRLPVVGDVVTLALEDHLRIALSPPADRKVVSIGNYVDSDLPVYLDVDHLLGKHTAIVGTTGCGKSYTVARLIQQLVIDYPGGNVVVFDLHGEYRNCFPNARHIRADLLSLPAWLHGFDDLFALCADLSNQFNIHNQRWAFRDGMLKLKQEYCRTVLEDSALADKIDLDAPIPFKFDHLQNYLHNLNSETRDSDTDAIALEATETEEWFTRQMRFQPKKRSNVSGVKLNGDLDRLVLRVDARVNDIRYAFMFKFSLKGKDDLPDIVRQMTGFLADKSSPVTVFDLSYLPSETVGTVVATISRMLFQVHFLAERGATTPTLAVYEEAHNYISRSGRGAYGEARDSVERIAKEGRKFGIGALVVSQRPSELSETLLSQCNTFLCMRLANTADKNHVLALLPDSMQMLADVLPSLPRGQVVAIGQATKMPVRLEVSAIEDKDRVPNSGDPEFGKHWSVQIGQRTEPNIVKICDYWIRSEKPKPSADTDGEKGGADGGG